MAEWSQRREMKNEGQTAERILLQALNIFRLSKDRVGKWTVVFDRFVVDAAGLHAVDEMINHKGGSDTVDHNRFRKTVFFGDLFSFIRIGLVSSSLVDDLGWNPIFGPEFIFDPKAVRISKAHRFVAPR